MYEKTRIRLDYQPVEAETGKEVAVLRFENPTQGIWTVIVIREGGNGSGNFNMWLPIRQFINGTAEFLQPDVYKRQIYIFYKMGYVFKTAMDWF